MDRISKGEIDILVKKLEDNSSTRRNEKTFTFTTVLAVLGVAFAAKEFIQLWFYLLPYFIILPYTAHISYYRIIHARLNSYLMEFAPEYCSFNIIGKSVPEGRGFWFRVIEILNNYELFLLSITSMILFYSNCGIPLKNWDITNYIVCATPFILSGVIFVITWYGKRYAYWVEKFSSQWQKEVI